MRKRNDELPYLSRLERDVMRAVWELTEDAPDCTSTEVVERYRETRALADTTIRTVLRNLRKKGYLEPVPTIERGMRLRPTVAQDAVARRTFRDLVEGFFEGSPRQAISFLLKDESINEGELEEIRRLLDDRRDSPPDRG